MSSINSFSEYLLFDVVGLSRSRSIGHSTFFVHLNSLRQGLFVAGGFLLASSSHGETSRIGSELAVVDAGKYEKLVMIFVGRYPTKYYSLRSHFVDIFYMVWGIWRSTYF